MMGRVSFFLIVLAFSLLVVVSGCILGDDDYAVAEEEYAVGWVLHNVNDSTDTVLSFGLDDVAVYNYSFNYPASVPDYFLDYIYWIPPVHVNGSYAAYTGGNYMALPLNRTYYLFGEMGADSSYYYNNWSFSHFAGIYYDYDGALREEHYRSISPYFAITPRAGDKAVVSFGGAPFRTANVVVSGGRIGMSGELVLGRFGNAYLVREVLSSRYPDAPVYRIVENGTVVGNSSLVYGGVWNSSVLDYAVRENSSYVVDVFVPTGYPVWSSVNISAYIANSSALDVEPPRVLRVDGLPSFSDGDLYRVTVNVSDVSDIGNVSAFFRSDSGFWVESDVGNVSGLYNASIVVSGFSFLDFMFVASDSYGNHINYTVGKVALSLNNADIVLDSIDDIVINGSVVYVSGYLKDGNGHALSDMKIDFYVDGNRSSSVITEYTGRFEFLWDVDFDSFRNADLSVAFDGTGIYGASVESDVVAVSDHYCGDGSCNSDESCTYCSADCGACTPDAPSSSGGGGGAAYVPLNHECEENSDCESDEKCSDEYKCVGIVCGLCRYPVDHACRKYVCCNDGDCLDGMVCSNHSCVKLKVNESVLDVADYEGVKSFVESVRQKVVESGSSKNVSVPMELVDEALMLIELGDYEKAMSVADEALAALDKAESIVIGATDVAQVSDDGGLDTGAVILLVVVLVCVAVMIYLIKDWLVGLLPRKRVVDSASPVGTSNVKEIDGLLADLRILVLRAGVNGDVGDDVGQKLHEIELERDKIAELEKRNDPGLNGEINRILGMIESLNTSLAKIDSVKSP